MAQQLVNPLAVMRLLSDTINFKPLHVLQTTITTHFNPRAEKSKHYNI